VAVSGRIDWKAVAMGAVVTVTVGVLVSVTVNALGLTDRNHQDSNLWFVFFWLDFLGAAAGGFIAGSRRPDMPALHGALVGALSYAAIAVFATTITLVSGHAAPRALQLVSGVLLLALGGTVGGLVASRRADRARPSTDS